jgi:hypothetical protein
MTKSTFTKLLGCLAWAGVAVSSAAPADAWAVTMQSGPYASCSGNYSTTSYALCVELPYIQTIKFVSTECSAGACSDITGSTRTEWLYSSGRKPASRYDWCAGSFWLWELDSCSC